MAEEQINIEVLLNTAKSAKSVEELEDSIKDLKNAATKIGAGGEGFDKLVNTAGSLKRRIEDVEQSVDKASKGLKGLQNFVNIGTSIAAGFSIAEGAAGLFGDENEELTKSIQKVTSAMAILNGLQEIRTLLIEETTIATRAMTAAQTLYTNVTKSAIVQTKLFRIALISTGIGALVVLIGALVANWEKLTGAIGNSSFMLRRKNKVLEKNSDLNKLQIELIEKRIELLGDETDKLEELTKQREKEYKDEVKIQEERLKNQRKLLKETEENYILTQKNITSSIPEAIWFGIFGASENDVTEAKTKIKEIENAYIEAQINLKNIQSEPTQNLINELERQKDLQEAQGEDTIELERRILKEKVNLYTEGTEEYKDAQNEIKVFEANVERERTEKLKEEEEKRKELLKEATEKRIELLQSQLVAQGEYYKKLSELRVVGGDTGTPGIIEDIQNLINENKTFIDSLNDTEQPLDNLIKTFELLSKNFNSVTIQSENFNSSLDEEGNIIATSTQTQLDFISAKGDEFGVFYDNIRGKLTSLFLEGDRKKFEEEIDKSFTTFEERFSETEGYLEKQRVFTSILDGYQRAFDLISLNTQTGLSEDLETFFVSLRDKLILEDIVKYEDVFDEDLKALLRGDLIEGEVVSNIVSEDDLILIEKYGVDLNRLRSGTEEYNKQYEKLLDYFIQQETILKGQEGAFKGLNEEQKQLLTQDIEGLAKTQLDALIKVITQTTILEDGIRGVSFEYQQLNNELKSQADNTDLLVGSIKANLDTITKDFDFSQLIDGGELGLSPEDFQKNIDTIITQLEKFGLDRIVIDELTQEEQLRILELFQEKAVEKNKETKDEIKQIWEDGFLSLYGELSNFIISVSDRITESRIRNAELARDAEIRAIDDVENAYKEQQSNLSNADKARLVKEKEFENQRDVIRKKAGKEIAELEMKNAMLQWELRLGEAVATTALNVIKALGNPPFPGVNIAAATLAGTLGGIQVATLMAQQPKMSDFQQFSTGGMVIGPGTSTSDSIPAMLSNGEAVINAKSTKMFLPQLDMINKMGGGSPLIPSYNQGGIIQGGTTNIDTSGMEEIMMMMNNRPIKTYVVSQDITNAQHNDSVLKNRTTF